LNSILIPIFTALVAELSSFFRILHFFSYFAAGPAFSIVNMAVLQTSLAIFIAHIILLLGLPASLVAAAPVAVPISPVNNVLVATEKRSASSYWVANVERQGIVPFAKSPDYKIFRNVKDYGAKGQSIIHTSFRWALC
jgi:hypothetical protein